MIELYGARGQAWLRHLPELLTHCEARWGLRVQPPFPELSYNYVCPAVRDDGSQVVLKVGVPTEELYSEIEALRHYDGQGAVRLLDADAERGMLLLERLLPGQTLLTIDDDEAATDIAAEVMLALWRPAPAEHSFPTVAQWAEGLQGLRDRFDGRTGPLPPTMVALAERLFEELLAADEAPMLLHGDLHHMNILSAARAPWLAIDPKGVVGPAGYEVGAFLRNALPTSDSSDELHRLLARHVDQFATHLSLPREQLAAWGVAHAVLSAWWSVEDHGVGWEPALRCADMLSVLL